MSSTPFLSGKNIIPAESERDASKFTPADSITMKHEPSPVKPLPTPDSIALNGAEPASE